MESCANYAFPFGLFLPFLTKRYKSATEFKLAIVDALQKKGTGYRFKEWLYRNWKFLTGAAVLAVMALLFIIFAL